jgi:hypothetical protein
MTKPVGIKRMSVGSNAVELREVRLQVEAVKKDVAVAVAHLTAMAETMTELRVCLKGEDGLTKRVIILWDRQERATRMLMWVGGIAMTALATSAAKLLIQ